MHTVRGAVADHDLLNRRAQQLAEETTQPFRNGAELLIGNSVRRGFHLGGA